MRFKTDEKGSSFFFCRIQKDEPRKSSFLDSKRNSGARKKNRKREKVLLGHSKTKKNMKFFCSERELSIQMGGIIVSDTKRHPLISWTIKLDGKKRTNAERQANRMKINKYSTTKREEMRKREMKRTRKKNSP